MSRIPNNVTELRQTWTNGKYVIFHAITLLKWAAEYELSSHGSLMAMFCVSYKKKKKKYPVSTWWKIFWESFSSPY